MAGRLLELRQIRKDFAAVIFSVYVEISFTDDASGIDEKGVAGGKFGNA